MRNEIEDRPCKQSVERANKETRGGHFYTFVDFEFFLDTM